MTDIAQSETVVSGTYVWRGDHSVPINTYKSYHHNILIVPYNSATSNDTISDVHTTYQEYPHN